MLDDRLSYGLKGSLMADTFELLEQEWISKVIIRQLRQEDLPELEWDGQFRHFRRVFHTAYQRAQRGLSLLWVVELPGKGIIGQIFIQITCDRPELADGVSRAYFYSFRIRPLYRGFGLGKRVLKFIEEDLQTRGFSFVTLNVAKTNERARTLYESVGYKVVAHEPGNWSYTDHHGKLNQVHEPAWRMEKKL